MLCSADYSTCFRIFAGRTQASCAACVSRTRRRMAGAANA
jgi:hypothetical protein